MKSFQGMLFLWFWGQVISYIIEASYLGQGDMDFANALTGFNSAQLAGPGILLVPKVGYGFIMTALPHALVWNFSFFEGEWRIIQLMLIIVFDGPFIYENVIKPFLFALLGVFQKFL